MSTIKKRIPKRKSSIGNLNLQEQMFLNHGFCYLYHDKRHPRDFKPFGDGKDEELMKAAWIKNRELLMSWEGRSGPSPFADPGFPKGTKPWAFVKFEMPHVEGEEEDVYLMRKRGFDSIKKFEETTE